MTNYKLEIKLRDTISRSTTNDRKPYIHIPHMWAHKAESNNEHTLNFPLKNLITKSEANFNWMNCYASKIYVKMHVCI